MGRRPTLLKHMRAWLLGLFPWAEPPGIKAYGEVSFSSPVLLTGNSGLTHLALSSALGEIGAYVVSMNTHGRDLLSAAAGDLLGTEQVIEALSQSGIAERVEHRNVILSGALQPFVDPTEVEAACRWKVVWGPYDVALLEAFLQGDRDMPAEGGVALPLRDRLRIVCSCALPTSLVMALPGLLIELRAAAWVFGLCWLAILLLELSRPVLQPQGGWIHRLAIPVVLGLTAGGVSFVLSSSRAIVGAVWAGAATIVSVWLACVFPARALPAVEGPDGSSDRESVERREMRSQDSVHPSRMRQTDVVEERG